jgi:hypothetical protein
MESTLVSHLLNQNQELTMLYLLVIRTKFAYMVSAITLVFFL